MKSDRSDARNTIALPISSGSANLFNGTLVDRPGCQGLGCSVVGVASGAARRDLARKPSATEMPIWAAYRRCVSCRIPPHGQKRASTRAGPRFSVWLARPTPAPKSSSQRRSRGTLLTLAYTWQARANSRGLRVLDLNRPLLGIRRLDTGLVRRVSKLCLTLLHLLTAAIGTKRTNDATGDNVRFREQSGRRSGPIGHVRLWPNSDIAAYPAAPCQQRSLVER